MSIASERAETRKRIVTKLADEFEASGIVYNCGRNVTEFVESRGVHDRQIKRMTWDEIHRRWQASQK